MYVGKSPQNGTERVSVTSANTFFPLKDWAKMKSESSIIYVTMEKTLPKALRTQVLTALTSNFGLVGLVQYAWSAKFDLVW